MSKIVMLGTAHLSSTPGKRSPDGKFLEYKYSRKVCLEVQKRLIDAGVDCRIDYIDDDMPGADSSKELINRVNIVNNLCKAVGSSNVLYCSIHVNAGPGTGWSKATGYSIYTSPGETESDKAATMLFNAAEGILKPLGKTLRRDMSDGDPDYEENFYVLRKTSCPAVLTENFFQSTKSDIEFLESPLGFEAIVSYHVLGILNYISK